MNQIDLTRIDLNLLAIFEVLMEERQVSRAAERLGRTQSALSHALARLRRQLGDPLLVRVGGTMQPSPLALALSEEIQPILRSIRRTLAPRQPFDPATSERVFRIAMADFWSFAVVDFLAHAARHASGIGVSWSALRETSCWPLPMNNLILSWRRAHSAARTVCGARLRATLPGVASCGRATRLPRPGGRRHGSAMGMLWL